MDGIDICAIILMIIGAAIFVPILCYSLYQFYEISNTQFIKHRRKHIVYSMNMITIISFLSERIYVICIAVLSFVDTSIQTWTCCIGIAVFIWLFYTLFLMRTWLLYYSRHYQLDLVDFMWQKDLNSNSVSWYISNRKKYGSFYYCYKFAVLPFLFYLFIELGSDLMFGKGAHDHILNVILPLNIYIPSFIIYYKMRHFNDIFYIRLEIYYQCITLFIIMVVMVVVHTIFVIVDTKTHNHENGHENAHEKSERIEWLISAAMTYIALFVMSLISTAYPVFLYGKKMLSEHMQLEDTISTNSTTHDFDDMLKTLETVDGYKAFMAHLVNHFATENLLFLTEVIQIKHEYQVKNNNMVQIPKNIDLQFDNDQIDNIINPSNEYIAFDFAQEADAGIVPIEDGNTVKPLNYTQIQRDSPDMDQKSTLELTKFPSMASSNFKLMISGKKSSTFTFIFRSNGTAYCKIKIPLKLPKSAILDKYDNLLDQMTSVFYKYIKIGSDHEINISFSQRLELINLFEKNPKKIKSENDLFNIMGEVCIEILSLCYGSYHAFTAGCSDSL